MAKKYAEKHNREVQTGVGEPCLNVGWYYILVEAEAGNVGVFDGVGIIRLGFAEGEGEVLDMVLDTDLLLITNYVICRCRSG